MHGGIGIRGNVTVATFNAPAFRAAVADVAHVDDDNVTIDSVMPLPATASTRRAVLQSSGGVDVRYSVDADDAAALSAQLGAVDATALARSLSSNGFAVSSADLTVTEAPAVADAATSAAGALGTSCATVSLALLAQVLA